MSTTPLPTGTHLGKVTLLVKNLDLEERFYHDVIGFEVLSKTAQEITLGFAKKPLLILQQDTELPYAERKSAGLYHTAFLYESPGELARTLLRIFQIAPNLFQGAGDHSVSQAFYLSDPEGNGLELYIDRPRSAWTKVDGQLQMDALPIDIEAFITEQAAVTEKGSISVGHIHLKVGSIKAAKAFYVDTLGFSVVIEHPTALFVSVDGYHHHIGLNTWESAGAKKRRPALGLAQFEIVIPDGETSELEDPWGTKLALTNKD